MKKLAAICLLLPLLTLSLLNFSFDSRVKVTAHDPRGLAFDRAPAALQDESPFRIITNDGEVLRLLFSSQLPEGLSYKILFPDKLKSIHRPAVAGELHQIEMTDSGVYTISLYHPQLIRLYNHYVPTDYYARHERELWHQDVFVQVDKDFSLSHSQIAEIATTFSPVVLMHENEKFLPSSLGYIFNIDDPDRSLEQEQFVLSFDEKRALLRSSTNSNEASAMRTDKKLVFNFEDIVPALAQFGTTDALIDIGSWQKIKSSIQRRYGRPEHTTIYYCYFEKDRKLYISYYFFYSFDPKNVLFNPMVTHIFDRESYTMVYDLDQNKPDYFVYFSHLPNQTIGLGDELKKNFKTWKGGKLYLNWEEIPKWQDRPIISIAEGSHAVYPFPGNYGVFPVGVSAIKLIEEAGGDKRILLPRGYQYHSIPGSQLLSYQLRDLQIGRITSESWNNMLGFSGKFIDIFSIPFVSGNLNFPPFTERETDIYQQVSKETTYHFQLKVLPTSTIDQLGQLKDRLRTYPIP